MFIYFFLLLSLLFLGHVYKNNRSILLLSFLILVFIGCFRDISIGSDTSGGYYENWKAISMDTSTWGAFSEMEPGFCFIMAIFKTYIADNYNAFYGTIHFLTMLFFCKMICKFCKNPNIGIAFLVLFLYYTNSFNLIRQSFALSITYPAFLFLKQKTTKYTLFYILYIVLVSFLIQRTLVVLVVLPLFVQSNLFLNLLCGRKGVVLILLSYLLSILSSKLLSYAPEISLLISIMGDRYAGYMSTYLDVEDMTGSTRRGLLNTIIAIYILLIYKKDENNDIFYACLILGVIINNLLGAFSALFTRVGYNLCFFQIFLFSNLWYKKGIGTAPLFRIVVLLYGLILFSNSILHNYCDVVPYKNVLF